MEYTLIFPHQLFKSHPALRKDRTVVLVEEWLFFRQFSFHKQKLLLHRASMQYYKDMLETTGFTVLYVNAFDEHADVCKLIGWLARKSAESVHFADVVDDWLRRRLFSACKQHKIDRYEVMTPAFINTMQDANAYFDQKSSYFQTDFYKDQRKRRGILVDMHQQPQGGHWSYDADNRKKFPKTSIAPTIHFPAENNYITQARSYVDQYFPDNYGDQSDKGFYPVTHHQAEQWLKTFLEERLIHFGTYEDAMAAKESFLYHSQLSPLLNIGLLEPDQVLQQTLEYAGKHPIPLNSLEGFIRQLMGWREYIRIVYEREGRRQRTINYWQFTRTIPKAFWLGRTGIAPVDIVINRALRHAYTHHIERLMIMGNFMLLCEFAPDEVYRWFMEMYIDAYDWVMVPNVYGMTQYADGGIMMTKPYISSSNYIKKMSDFKKGDWEVIWDALFWRFMSVHRKELQHNPRLNMLLTTWDKMPGVKRVHHLDTAEKFLQQLDSGKENITI